MTLRADAVIDAQDDTAAVIRHDARTLPLDDETVDLIVTSPPYFALRSYRDDGEHFGGQIGSEDTPDLFLDALDECMVEWGRVLKPSGSVWINLGDKYAGSGLGDTEFDGQGARDGKRRSRPGSVPGIRVKSLMGLPWRFAIRQIDAGWILRAEVVWDKPNGLPESVTDRVRRSHEQWFHFVKEPRYFSGVDEIREPHINGGVGVSTAERKADGWGPNRGLATGTQPMVTFEGNPLGRLPGSVWTIPTEPLLIPDDTRQLLDLPDHFAAFPQEWPRRIITGWSPTGICTVCGEGRRPVVESDYVPGSVHVGTPSRPQGQIGKPVGGPSHQDTSDGAIAGRKRPQDMEQGRMLKFDTLIGYACACPTPDAPTTPAVILDPFGGTGTVAGVAKTLGRYGISNDLSESYNRLAAWRIWQSGHFTKTEQRSWADRQTSML